MFPNNEDICSVHILAPKDRPSPPPNARGGKLLHQVKEFKYLGVFLSTSEGKIERKIGRLLCGASAVMQAC